MSTLTSLCVYCGSSVGDRAEYSHAAEALGALLASRKIRLVYGGGNVGLMGVIATAVLRAGGEVVGVIPRALMEKELGLRSCTELLVVESMHERKKLMADKSDGFVAMAGGIGTLEELFETFTWQQLRFHDKPLGLLNTLGFYDGLLEFLEHTTASRFLARHHKDSLQFDADPEALLDKLAAWQPNADSKWAARLDAEGR
jgi:uncharacterized protein (TIGR00730 family)